MLRIQLHTIHLSFAHLIRFPHTARSALLTYPPLLTECVASILMIQICIFNHATNISPGDKNQINESLFTSRNKIKVE